MYLPLHDWNLFITLTYLHRFRFTAGFIFISTGYQADTTLTGSHIENWFVNLDILVVNRPTSLGRERILKMGFFVNLTLLLVLLGLRDISNRDVTCTEKMVVLCSARLPRKSSEMYRYRILWDARLYSRSVSFVFPYLWTIYNNSTTRHISVQLAEWWQLRELLRRSYEIKTEFETQSVANYKPVILITYNLIACCLLLLQIRLIVRTW